MYSLLDGGPDWLSRGCTPQEEGLHIYRQEAGAGGRGWRWLGRLGDGGVFAGLPGPRPYIDYSLWLRRVSRHIDRLCHLAISRRFKRQDNRKMDLHSGT